MTDTSHKAQTTDRVGPIAQFMRATEIDPRLLGMVGALVLIGVGFHIYSAIFMGEGTFLTPRNLWNLSVQTASIGIMATGMVLIIITRNIDLSVGSLVGVTAMIMGILQVEILPKYLGLGSPYIWIITLVVGIAAGVLIGAFHGWLTAYCDIPSFIVTLGGLLIWRSAAFLVANGKTISPVDETFALMGGGPYGAIGATGSWIVGLLACAGVIWGAFRGRGNRQMHGFALRPIWAEVFMTVLACGVVIGSVLVVNAYPWPKGILTQYYAKLGQPVPEGIFISHGFAYPVLILVAVGLVMAILVRSTR
ncbi:MAG: sugar ABC transporter permease, partial [Candidatus Saccharibacteria bacterium]|nr:sugar ABC transporter permease [Pseudorhodobacter sp.]